MLIREMRPEEKPRERFKESAGDVSITDLIAILIRTGRKNHSVREVASDVVSFLEENCGEAWIEEPYWKDLTDIPGIGADKRGQRAGTKTCRSVPQAGTAGFKCSGQSGVLFYGNAPP